VDSFSLRRSKGDLTGVDPVDRGKRGSKLHLAGERGDLPLSVVLSVANTADSALFEAVLGRHPGDPDADRPPAAPPARCMASTPTIIAVAGRSTSAWHPLPDRPPHDRALGLAWPLPPDDRAYRRLAWWMAAEADPL
jgi:hypothetical protein